MLFVVITVDTQTTYTAGTTRPLCGLSSYATFIPRDPSCLTCPSRVPPSLPAGVITLPITSCRRTHKDDSPCFFLSSDDLTTSIPPLPPFPPTPPPPLPLFLIQSSFLASFFSPYSVFLLFLLVPLFLRSSFISFFTSSISHSLLLLLRLLLFLLLLNFFISSFNPPPPSPLFIQSCFSSSSSYPFVSFSSSFSPLDYLGML